MITNEDRYAVLERKLMEAESALFGCRAILNQIRRSSDGGPSELGKGNILLDSEGIEKPLYDPETDLYEGQFKPPGLQLEETEEECIK